jgi:demethylmenaquinone methyltransferase/2-methoxy-6-polyprenyl-1,4-benzoquinol methylase
MADKDSSTHFGFRTVDSKEKAGMVRGVFDSVASKYDVMNDLMSFGVHRLWKRFAVELAGVRRGQRILDLASGTGDLADRFADLVGPDGLVLMTDINAAMLQVGRDRMVDRGHAGNLNYVQVNAESLPVPDDSLDLVTIAFGLRNVTHKEKALRAMYQSLKPGGRALILEFSKPLNKPLEKVYDLYSFKLLPKMGELVAKDADSYRYLAESIRMHTDQNTQKGKMEDAGFERCDVHNLTGGIVAVHRGFKI